MLKTEMVKGVVGRGGGRRREEEEGGGRREEEEEEEGGGKRGEGRGRGRGRGRGGGVTALRASILYKKYSTQHSTSHVLTAKVKAFRAISLPATVSRSATTHTLSCLVTNSPAPERKRER